MSRQWILTQEAFDRLLLWLAPNREKGGEKYERIRSCLIKIFTCRGCPEANELADETINRVARKLPDIAATYQGDPALYFYGVAQKVILETSRKKPPVEIARDLAEMPVDVEPDYQCLEQCMQQLTPKNRQVILEYYSEEKGAKINHRKLLAQRFGVGINALRIRAYRIRASLQRCVTKCLKFNGAP